VNPSAETQVDYDAVCAASIETEDRDGEVASLGIEITPRLQIRARIMDVDRSRSRPGFWLNLELGGLEAGDTADASMDETDEWRWTFGHLNVSNHPPGLACHEERAQERGHGSNQSYY
jgi:hypothetical protein